MCVCLSVRLFTEGSHLTTIMRSLVSHRSHGFLWTYIQTCSLGKIKEVCNWGRGSAYSREEGVCIQWGWADPSELGKRAVRILLECFLVMLRDRTWWNFCYLIFLFLVLHLPTPACRYSPAGRPRRPACPSPGRCAVRYS